jgi:PAS domain-containing protein
VKGRADTDDTTSPLAGVAAITLFDRLPVPLLGVDTDGVVQLANDSVGQMVGCAPHELRGRPLEWVILEESEPGESPLAWMFRLAGRAVPFRYADLPFAFAYLSRPVILGDDVDVAVIAIDDVTEPIWMTNG